VVQAERRQDFFAVFFAVLLEVLFLAVLLVVDFFAGDFLAVLFLAVLFAGDFLAVDDELDVVVDFLAGVDFDVDFFAVLLDVLFFAVLLAGDFFAVEELDLLALFFAEDFWALPELVFLPVAAAAPFLAAAAVLVAVLLAAPGAAFAVASDSLGSFLAPETTAFSSAPALNFGTVVFLDFIRSPVAGLRTQRAARTRFSKEPKPVMATFSPLATSRVMVSSTDSSAWAAALRLPS
jgi:putative acetyltransferase